MTDEQIFFSWHTLAADGRVKEIKELMCLEGHGLLHPFLKQAPNGEYYARFECLVCEQKVAPGLDLLTRMRKAVYDAYDEESLG